MMKAKTDRPEECEEDDDPGGVTFGEALMMVDWPAVAAHSGDNGKARAVDVCGPVLGLVAESDAATAHEAHPRLEPLNALPRPAPRDMVQVVMPERLARHFELVCSGGAWRLAGPIQFSKDHLPTYLIGVEDAVSGMVNRVHDCEPGDPGAAPRRNRP